MRIPIIFRKQIVDSFYAGSVSNLGRAVAGTFLLMAAFSGLANADPPLPNILTSQVFVVTNYGAIGDGVTNNAPAIQSAIDDAEGNGGGTVLIPAAGTLSTYLCGPINLVSGINLQIESNAMLQMLPRDTWVSNYGSSTPFINGSGLQDIEISGSGTIDGQGTNWWFPKASTRPNFINLSGCTRVLIQDVTLQNPPTFHMMLKGNNVGLTIQNITIDTPFTSPNTDGMDLASTNVLIRNCYISVGDDNIEIGGSAAPATDITISNCTFGTGHGVSIGSLTQGGVNHLIVSNCTWSGTEYGIKMKTDRDRGGLIENLKYCDMLMTNVNIPFAFYEYYNTIGSPAKSITNTPAGAAADDIPSVTGTTPIFRNVTISNLTAYGNAGPQGPGTIAGIIYGLPEMLISNVTLYNVNILGRPTAGTFDIFNARAIQIIDSNLTTPITGTNTLTLFNAEVTVTNSAASTNVVTMWGLEDPGTNMLSFFNAQAGLSDTTVLGSSPQLTLAGSTLTVSNNLHLGGSTLLNFGLGTNSTQIVATGNLVLGGGILNITDGGGFAAGTYTLFSYGGTLTGSSLSIGTTPDGSMTYTLDTSTAGLVKLVAVVPVVAAFSGSPTSGFLPLEVTFTDTSTGPITNRFWNFGDGTTSNTTATSVAHTFTTAGTNTVQLIVSGTSGVSTSTLSGYITVAPCSATLSATNASFGVLGGSDIVSVTPTGVCTWTASSNDAWIEITGGSVTTNSSASVAYTVLPNASSTSPRIGTMTIADQTFTVTEAGDSVAPTVTLTAPTSGTVSSFIVVSATAADNVGVARVDFFRDSGILIGSFSAPSYSLSFNTATLGDASACFYAKAYDDAGNFSSSSTNCVAVDNHSVLPSLLGDYNGLVMETNAPSHESSGPVSFKVSKTGSFAAKLTLGGGRHLSFSGQFDDSGNATNTVTRKGLDPLQVAIHLDLAGNDQITGTVSNSSFNSVLIADRAVFDGANPCPFAGNFSILLDPPTTHDPTVPRGFGYGTLSVTATGRGRLRGVLADGTKISIMAPVSKLGTWPLYETLYKKHGAAIGWVAFTTNDTLDATVNWFRPPLSSSSLYPLGFTTNLTLTGNRYVPPARGNTSGAGNFQITLGGGNLESDIVKSAYLYSIGTVVVMSANPENVKIKLDPVTGQFKGSFVHPLLNKTVKFTGLLPEFRLTGAGYFLGLTESGFVIFTATP